MISDGGMAALRCGAALVNAAPGLRLRIRGGDRVLAEVGRPPFPDTGPPQIPACAFRAAVGRANEQRRAGSRLRFLTLPEGVDPAVDVGVAAGDRVLPGGIVRISLRGAWVHLAAVARLARGLEGVARHYDGVVDATVVHVATPAGDRAAAASAYERIEAALATCAVADLEDLLRVTAAGSRPR